MGMGTHGCMVNISDAYPTRQNRLSINSSIIVGVHQSLFLSHGKKLRICHMPSQPPTTPRYTPPLPDLGWGAIRPSLTPHLARAREVRPLPMDHFEVELKGWRVRYHCVIWVWASFVRQDAAVQQGVIRTEGDRAAQEVAMKGVNCPPDGQALLFHSAVTGHPCSVQVSLWMMTSSRQPAA